MSEAHETQATRGDGAGARAARATARTIADLGWWFVFFLVVYCILVIKVLTYKTVTDDLFFGFYSLLITTYILSRFLLAFFHKPVEFDPTYELTVTFVVPAKNEEDNIADTIIAFSKVDYPMQKIEIVAINDGSDDRTYEEMLRAYRIVAPQVRSFKVINWTENKGKRHGMAEGVLRATHEIVIFIDSDSFIHKDAVKHLVKYFSNPGVGAVSGHTDVHNRDTNLLTQMQALRYYIAFKIYKAAESVFGNVTCCPGCCSAYRREYLLPFIRQWLVQTFLGAPCTFGDDRSLTNYIIRHYYAVYSPEAVAYTVVPDRFGKYVRQQQRWKKSWIRETFIAGCFMWRRNALAAFSFYSYAFLAFVSPIVFFRAMVWYPITHDKWPLVYMAGLFLMLLLHGVYYRIEVGPRAWALAIATFWLNAILLIWQLPWALIRIRDSSWGTR